MQCAPTNPDPPVTKTNSPLIRSPRLVLGIRPEAGPGRFKKGRRASGAANSLHLNSMYMHLISYEPISISDQTTFAGAAVPVQQFPAHGAGAFAAVRRGVARHRAAHHAIYDSAGVFAGGGSDPGAAGRNAGDGQHHFDA